jgi:hypothetical protein
VTRNRRTEMGDDTADIELISTILEKAGLKVEQVPRAQGKRCDLRAQNRDERYLIESKGLHDDRAVRDELREGRPYAEYTNIAWTSPIADRIDEAIKQLRETADGTADDLRLIALIDRGSAWSGIILKLIFATLYGSRAVYSGETAHDCLYFSYSAFHKHRGELDGAIFVDRAGWGALCANDHSAHVQRLCDSTLGRWFAKRKLLHTAERLEREADYLVADCDVDRRHEAAVLGYLASKYHLIRPGLMFLNEAAAIIPLARQRPT